MTETAPPTIDPLIGQTIAGRFTVVSLLGQGGMGAVYVARQEPLGREVAIKVLNPRLTADPVAVERFKTEARLIAALRHQHVVGIHDFGVDDGHLFLALELMQGSDLRGVIQKGAVDPIRALRITRDVCRALVAAHDRGILHRDLKPENVFLEDHKGTGEVARVLDFGIAKICAGEGPVVTVGGGGGALTGEGLVAGTPGYLAPERIMGEGQDDPRTDLYALGVTWFEMVTGVRPFEADTPMKSVLRAVQEEPPSPSSLLQGLQLPPEHDLLIRQLMARRADHRPPTAVVLLEVLDRLLASAVSNPDLPQLRPSASLAAPSLSTTSNAGTQDMYASPAAGVATIDGTGFHALQSSDAVPMGVTQPTPAFTNALGGTSGTSGTSAPPPFSTASMPLAPSPSTITPAASSSSPSISSSSSVSSSTVSPEAPAKGGIHPAIKGVSLALVLALGLIAATVAASFHKPAITQAVPVLDESLRPKVDSIVDAFAATEMAVARRGIDELNQTHPEEPASWMLQGFMWALEGEPLRMQSATAEAMRRQRGPAPLLEFVLEAADLPANERAERFAQIPSLQNMYLANLMLAFMLMEDQSPAGQKAFAEAVARAERTRPNTPLVALTQTAERSVAFDPRGSITAAENGLRKSPSSSALLLGLARAQAALGRLDDAEANTLKAYRADPSPQVKLARANILAGAADDEADARRAMLMTELGSMDLAAEVRIRAALDHATMLIEMAGRRSEGEALLEWAIAEGRKSGDLGVVGEAMVRSARGAFLLDDSALIQRRADELRLLAADVSLPERTLRDLRAQSSWFAVAALARDGKVSEARRRFDSLKEAVTTGRLVVPGLDLDLLEVDLLVFEEKTTEASAVIDRLHRPSCERERLRGRAYSFSLQSDLAREAFSKANDAIAECRTVFRLAGAGLALAFEADLALRHDDDATARARLALLDGSLPRLDASLPAAQLKAAVLTSLVARANATDVDEPAPEKPAPKKPAPKKPAPKKP